MMFAGLMRCVHGATAVSFAVAAPALMGVIGIASDFATYTLKKNELQSAADQAALAATRELSVVASGTASSAKVAAAASVASTGGGGPVDSIARSYVDAALADKNGNTSTGVEIDEGAGAVKVTVTDNWKPFFAHFLGAKITPIVVNARAELVGESKICVLALTTSGVGAVSMTNDAHLDGKGCSVYSNSTNSSGFYLGTGSSVTADLVCSAGGVYNKGAMTGTQVLTDCPAIPDPLASRSPPAVGACDHTATIISGKTVTLDPGVYCGGITVTKGSSVTFKEGNYIIKDGLFLVTDTSKISGKNVAFYLTGTLSLVQFLGNATIDLSGAESGAMAGLLFFEDPSSGLFRIHNIRATNAFNLTGTIYLPRGNLLVDPTATVAAKSAYTAIIAKRLIVDNGPSLVLNTNYGATQVPVPDGIRSSADVVLSE
jgi:Flp pilus assembly protein TadG